jgi:glucose-6-phosphate isomerase
MLVDLPTYPALVQARERLRSTSVRALFDADPQRFARFHRNVGAWTVDFSKHRIDADVFALLQQLGRDAQVEQRRDAMFSGAHINVTEGRSVLHTALRMPKTGTLVVDGTDVVPGVHVVLEQMDAFVRALHDGSLRGATGARFTDIVNIGIGGSDLGPAMAASALRPYAKADLRAHFVSNVDRTHLNEALRGLDPASTLFVIVSKTFTTQETMTNASSARAWLAACLGPDFELSKHFVGVTTATREAAAFGVRETFPFWDWVGGRYSLWSAVGLSLACLIGMENFRELLAGAHTVDEHFRTAPLAENVPFILGALGIWWTNLWGAATHAVLPYDQYLGRLPAYLQQAEMESNGKSVSQDGHVIGGYDTCPIIFGEPGTNGQHAFYQLIHQGTRVVPVDFIVPLRSHNPEPTHHDKLVAHCLAQSQALMEGRSRERVEAELRQKGMADAEIARFAQHRVFTGSRPSTLMVAERVTPRALGELLAIYEHKIFVQGMLWNVCSYDQWGVELGKVLANAILDDVAKRTVRDSHDASTRAWIERYIGAREA